MGKYKKKPIEIEAEQWFKVTWIITGVKEEKYPCKPDIFYATYDEVR